MYSRFGQLCDLPLTLQCLLWNSKELSNRNWKLKAEAEQLIIILLQIKTPLAIFLLGPFLICSKEPLIGGLT